MELTSKIFRGFSIRGVVGSDLDSERMTQIARALAAWFQGRGGRRLATAHDVRVSSPLLHRALVDGLLRSGVQVIDIGPAPTPVLNFATDFYAADGGVMVTASHNPPEYNGLKIRAGRTIYGDDLQAIYALAQAGGFIDQPGSYQAANPLEAYARAVSERARLRRPLRVVVDGGNGMNGQVAPPLLRSLGCQVDELFCAPDGAFPNRDPDPTAAGATRWLAQSVRRIGADVGLAFDGDGDRVILVDEQGETVFGDVALMLLARHLQRKHGPLKVVYEVLCSQAVADDIRANGGQAIGAPSGYAYVHNQMLASGARLGGELSGHFFILDDVFRFDDALLTAACLLEALSEAGQPLSALTAALPRYHASREYRLPCPDGVKGQVVAAAGESYAASHPIERLDGVRVDFGGGWALIRQSNTQPVLSLRFESKVSAAHMEAIRAQVMAHIQSLYAARGLAWPAEAAQ
jgi:phosphomannomutase/phosphoglucomutase